MKPVPELEACHVQLDALQARLDVAREHRRPLPPKAATFMAHAYNAIRRTREALARGDAAAAVLVRMVKIADGSMPLAEHQRRQGLAKGRRSPERDTPERVATRSLHAAIRAQAQKPKYRGMSQRAVARAVAQSLHQKYKLSEHTVRRLLRK